MTSDEIPEDFMEALADFQHGRFVSMDIALAEPPARCDHPSHGDAVGAVELATESSRLRRASSFRT